MPACLDMNFGTHATTVHWHTTECWWNIDFDSTLQKIFFFFMQLCIAHVQSIEVQLNERGYDKFSLFVDVSYAKDIESQLREGGQQILISVIGCHNAGKSTLINAILGDE